MAYAGHIKTACGNIRGHKETQCAIAKLVQCLGALALLKIEGLVVYPGSELPILETTTRGAPGCISATANLNGKAIAEVLDLVTAGAIEDARNLHAKVREIRLTFQEYAPIPAQKSLLAIETRDQRWANVRPPLRALTQTSARALTEALKSLDFFKNSDV